MQFKRNSELSQEALQGSPGFVVEQVQKGPVARQDFAQVVASTAEDGMDRTAFRRGLTDQVNRCCR